MLPKWRIFFFNAFNTYINYHCKKILHGTSTTDWTHWCLPKPCPFFILHCIDQKQLKWKIIQLAFKVSFFEILFLCTLIISLKSEKQFWVMKAPEYIRKLHSICSDFQNFSIKEMHNINNHFSCDSVLITNTLCNVQTSLISKPILHVLII